MLWRFMSSAVLGLVLVAGRAVMGAQEPPDFGFGQDTFAFPNELVWEYRREPDGRMTHQRREPKPDYTHHCFVLARNARQFFYHARFDQTLPRTDEASYRRKVRAVLKRNPRKPASPEHRIVIPGYADLHSFSVDWEPLLKKEGGSAARSYFQRGHWRMVFPFPSRQRERIAARLAKGVQEGRAPVVHIVNFPALSINHALLLYEARPIENGWRFSAYDPNQPEQPTQVVYDASRRSFSFPENDYFKGGKVDLYEVYHALCY